jgi:hypothetical protein
VSAAAETSTSTGPLNPALDGTILTIPVYVADGAALTYVQDYRHGGIDWVRFAATHDGGRSSRTPGPS